MAPVPSRLPTVASLLPRYSLDIDGVERQLTGMDDHFGATASFVIFLVVKRCH